MLFRWRSGQTVSADEQLNLTEMEESMTTSVAANNFDRPTAQLSLVSSHISTEDRKKLEDEREKLFQVIQISLNLTIFSIIKCPGVAILMTFLFHSFWTPRMMKFMSSLNLLKR